LIPSCFGLVILNLIRDPESPPAAGRPLPANPNSLSPFVALEDHPICTSPRNLVIPDLIGIFSLSFIYSSSKPCPRNLSRRGSSPLFGLSAGNYKLPALKIVEHYSWTGVRHSELYPQMIDLLKNVWHCRRIVVDATGIGQPVASFLRQHLGSRVVPFTFTSPAKSQLGFNLLAAINSGRLKMYAADNSPEYKEFWLQMERAKSFYRPSQTLNFFVDPSDGHDDFLMSLALLVESAGLYKPRIAVGRGSFNHLA
jgi:hypothetical protein